MPNDTNLVNDARDGHPAGLDDVVATVDHALVALLDEVHPTAQVQSHAHHRPDGRVHALRVAARGEHGDHLALLHKVGYVALGRVWNVRLVDRRHCSQTIDGNMFPHVALIIIVHGVVVFGQSSIIL